MFVVHSTPATRGIVLSAPLGTHTVVATIGIDVLAGLAGEVHTVAPGRVVHTLSTPNTVDHYRDAQEVGLSALVQGF